MRCVAFRHDASMHIRGRIVADRNATHDASVWGGVGFAIHLTRIFLRKHPEQSLAHR